jgi:hypothetical protein
VTGGERRRNPAAQAYAIGEYGRWMTPGLDEGGGDGDGVLLWPRQFCPVTTPHPPSSVGLPRVRY